MRIDEFLGRLEGVKKISGGWQCKCPAHDDRKASLCVSLGDKVEGGQRIVLKCMAGCDTERVVERMGLTMKDLFYEQGSATPTPRKETKAPKPCDPLTVGSAYFNRGTGLDEKVTAVYDYRSDAGDVVLKVARTEQKSFPAQYLKDGKWYWGRGPYGRLLYMQPTVKKAIQDQETIYLVEGEKDADNLRKLGYCATTNLGGANKWQPEMSKTLQGADVVLIPDNDEPGRKSVERIRHELTGVARRIRVIDLKEACPELPEKGDVTDFFHQLGKAEGMKQLRRLAEAAPSVERDGGEAAAYYDGLAGYTVIDGKLCSTRGKTIKPLCNFVAVPTEEITLDAGAQKTKVLGIDGWGENGRRFPRLTVTLADFSKMNWPLEGWGMRANIEPGSTIKDQLRNAIQTAGAIHAAPRTVYTHTGWREVEGKAVYLHAGGAIGGDLSVDLTGDQSALAGYELTGATGERYEKMPPGQRLREGVNASLRCLGLAAMRITAPLLSFMYLAPLRSFLEETGNAPGFVPFVCGKTGSGKTTVTTLMLCHFGPGFSRMNVPGSFADTINSIRKKAFLLKDAPLLIDDYKPSTNLNERRKMEECAQLLCRMWGDGVERGRMRADTRLQEKTPPRGLGIETGEELPNIGDSGLARLYVINVARGQVNLDDETSELEELARDGLLTEAMKGYIEWLAEKRDTLPQTLERLFRQYRAEAAKGAGEAHKRLPSACAFLLVGATMMLRFFADAGAMDAGEIEDQLGMYRALIYENVEAQTLQMGDESSKTMFLNAVSEMIRSGRVIVKDLKTVDPKVKLILPKDTIGYADEEYYYLFPAQTYSAVQKLYTEQGKILALTQNALFRQLVEDGDALGDGKRTTRNICKCSGAIRGRFLMIRRRSVDGYVTEPEPPEPEQTYLPVEQDEDNPF